MIRHLVFAFWIPVLCAAEIYHVRSTGNDSAAGSESAPWASINHASTQAVAGDTVLVRGGTYNERVVFGRSGTSEAYIVFRAAPGETVIVDGSGIQESWGNPLFADTSSPDFSLQSSSPAIDTGDPSILSEGERDLRGLSDRLCHRTPVLPTAL